MVHVRFCHSRASSLPNLTVNKCQTPEWLVGSIQKINQFRWTPLVACPTCLSLIFHKLFFFFNNHFYINMYTLILTFLFFFNKDISVIVGPYFSQTDDVSLIKLYKVIVFFFIIIKDIFVMPACSR